MQKRNSRIQCLDRTMDILELLADNGEMGVSEIARAMDLHVATVHNILKTLGSRSYVLNHDGRYSIGPAIARLALKWEPVNVIPRLSQSALEEVTRQTGESATVSVLLGDKTFSVASTLGTSELIIRQTREHPTTLKYSTGRLLIAFEDKKTWPEHIHRHLKSEYHSPTDPQTEDEWIKELERMRKEKFVIRKNSADGTDSVGTVIHGPNQDVVASIGASCPASRSTDAHLKKMLKAVRAAAKEISRRLGGLEREKNET